MCKRKRRLKQKRVQKGKTKAKKKRTCCQKCRRKIRKWLCNKIKRCVKKTVFGDPNPQLDDFDIGGINLGSVRDFFKKDKSRESLKKGNETVAEKKGSVITIFKNSPQKSSKSIPIKDALINEFDRYSISKSIPKKVKSFINDFRERNLFLGISKDSQLNLKEEEKERFKNLANKYERKSVFSKDLASIKSYDKLRRKFSLTASKNVMFKNMIDDYKKGIFIPSDSNIKQMIDNNNINKQDLHTLLAHYETQKKKDRIIESNWKGYKDIPKKIYSKYKKNTDKNLELLRNMNSQDLKKKFSLTNSKLKLVGHMVDDFKNGKISLSSMPHHIKKDMKTLSKENINHILDYYKQHKKAKHYPFVKQSKLKQLKSDLRAKIGFL